MEFKMTDFRDGTITSATISVSFPTVPYLSLNEFKHHTWCNYLIQEQKRLKILLPWQKEKFIYDIYQDNTSDSGPIVHQEALHQNTLNISKYSFYKMA